MRQGERGEGRREGNNGGRTVVLDVFCSSLVILVFYLFLRLIYGAVTKFLLFFFQWTDKLAKIIILKTSSKRVARFLLSERGERKKGEREREKEDGVSFLTNERTRVA